MSKIFRWKKVDSETKDIEKLKKDLLIDLRQELRCSEKKCNFSRVEMLKKEIEAIENIKESANNGTPSIPI
jgi:hypothetical protein